MIETSSNIRAQPIARTAPRALRLPYQAYFECFLLALVLCWLPSKLLGYIAPFGVLVWFVLRTGSQRTVRNTLIWLMLWAASVVIHALLLPSFFFQSALLTLLTYSAWITVFSIPNYAVRSGVLWDKMLRYLRWVIGIEATLGIVQAIYGYTTQTGTFGSANGDFVEGTIHPALPSSLSMSNPIFAINMTLMLIAIFPSVLLHGRGRMVFALGLVSLVLASVKHGLLFLAIAMAVSVVFFRIPILRRKSGLMIVAVGMVGVALVYLALGNVMTRVQSFARLTLEGATPRSQVIIRAVTTMPSDYVHMPWIGLGPGQFSSRAGLIATGLYFGRPESPRTLPLLSPGMSDPFEENVIDLWLYFPGRRTNSSTFQPFLSWLSLYAEWGILALVAAAAVLVTLLFRVRNRVKSHPDRIHAVAFGSGAIFIFLLGGQENYWEMPQVLLIGLLTWKVLYVRLMRSEPASN